MKSRYKSTLPRLLGGAAVVCAAVTRGNTQKERRAITGRIDMPTILDTLSALPPGSVRLSRICDPLPRNRV